MNVPDISAGPEELDLGLAAELQAALLPKECPAVCAHHTAAARNRMCGRVGGDFYDLIALDANHAAIVIGDVIGHGVRAALLMAKILGLLRSDLAEGRDDPCRAVAAVNQALLDVSDRAGMALPVSMVYGVIDTGSGVGRFVNAGHPEPLLHRRPASEWIPLAEHGLLLGVEEYEPEAAEQRLQPGDRLVLLTDGLLDGRNPDGEFFGLRRLRALLDEEAQSDADSAADAVFHATRQFRGEAEQLDDETLLIIDRL